MARSRRVKSVWIWRIPPPGRRRRSTCIRIRRFPWAFSGVGEGSDDDGWLEISEQSNWNIIFSAALSSGGVLDPYFTVAMRRIYHPIKIDSRAQIAPCLPRSSSSHEWPPPLPSRKKEERFRERFRGFCGSVLIFVNDNKIWGRRYFNILSWTWCNVVEGFFPSPLSFITIIYISSIFSRFLTKINNIIPTRIYIYNWFQESNPRWWKTKERKRREGRGRERGNKSIPFFF